MQGPAQVNSITIFSSPEGCIGPSSTMKASQQGGPFSSQFKIDLSSHAVVECGAFIYRILLSRYIERPGTMTLACVILYNSGASIFNKSHTDTEFVIP